MAEKPEQNIVGVVLAEHHGFEVEFDKGLAAEACIVAENPHLQTVGYESPKVIGRAVQCFLKKTVRAAARGPGNTLGRPVQIDAATHEVNGSSVPAVGDRVGFSFYLDWPGGEQPTVAQFLKE